MEERADLRHVYLEQRLSAKVNAVHQLQRPLANIRLAFAVAEARGVRQQTVHRLLLQLRDEPEVARQPDHRLMHRPVRLLLCRAVRRASGLRGCELARP